GCAGKPLPCEIEPPRCTSVPLSVITRPEPGDLLRVVSSAPRIALSSATTREAPNIRRPAPPGLSEPCEHCPPGPPPTPPSAITPSSATWPSYTRTPSPPGEDGA